MHQWQFFSLGLKILWSFCFCRFEKNEESQFENKTFQKFSFALKLMKLSFFRAQNIQICSFLITRFERDQRSQFEKKNFAEINKYFQLHQWSFFSLSLKILRFFYFCCWFERARGTVWKQNISWSIFCLGGFMHVSTLRKNYFQLHQWSFSVFRPKNALILSFLLMLVWERSRVTVWKKVFPSILFALTVLIMYLSLVKNIFNCISESFFP